MTYYIIERYDNLIAAVIFESSNLEETVKYWYSLFKGKELYFDDGWDCQAVVGWNNGLCLSGCAHEQEGKYHWHLGTITGDKEMDAYYECAKKGTENYYEKVAEAKQKELREKKEARKKQALGDKYRQELNWLRKWKTSSIDEENLRRKFCKTVWYNLYYDIKYWSFYDDFEERNREDVGFLADIINSKSIRRRNRCRRQF